MDSGGRSQVPQASHPVPGIEHAPPELRTLLTDTVAALRYEQVADESLGAVKHGRRFGPVSMADKMTPWGRAWRLGVLLLDARGNLYRTGTVTRAIVPLRGVNNLSALAESRREDRRTAARGKFPEGEVVNFYYEPIDLSPEGLASGLSILSLQGDAVLVRWHRTFHPRALADYLAERVELATRLWGDDADDGA